MFEFVCGAETVACFRRLAGCLEEDVLDLLYAAGVVFNDNFVHIM